MEDGLSHMLQAGAEAAGSPRSASKDGDDERKLRAGRKTAESAEGERERAGE